MYDALIDDTHVQVTGMYEGVVTTAPGDYDETAGVTLDGFDDELEFGGVRWMPRHDAPNIPAEGDPCVVFLPESGDAWMIGWWPHA